jgi:hypothetical protein
MCLKKGNAFINSIGGGVQIVAKLFLDIYYQALCGVGGNDRG